MHNSFAFDPSRYQQLLATLPMLVNDDEQPDLEEIKTLFSCIDNTTLNGNDTEASVRDFALRTLSMHSSHVPHVAAICVYPFFVPLLKECLKETPLSIAAVAGGFPAGQLPMPLKINEVKQVVEMGADEVDYVINRGVYLSAGAQALFDEVAEARAACPTARLKVILEVGELPSPALIYNASIAALQAGADIIKTSTGKIPVGATPQAACAMLMALADYRQFSQKNVGFKAAGGIRSLSQALTYYRLTAKLLKVEKPDKHIFRIGTSSLTPQLHKLLTF